MKMRKILITTVIAIIFNVGCMADSMPCYSMDEFIKKFPNNNQLAVKYGGMTENQKRVAGKRDIAEYRGAFWSQSCLGGINPSGEAPLGSANIGVHIGCGYGNSATQYDLKIIIKQENPCYVTKDKGYIDTTTKKIDRNTVEVLTKGKVWCDISSINLGRRGLDYKYNPLDKNVKNVLGNSTSCLREENSEIWEIYYKNGASWKKMGREKFTFTKDHWVLQGKDPKRTHKSYKTQIQTNQKTRIKIYKFGASDGFGRTFNTPAECEAERVKLTKSHKGLDYSYTCEKI
jgi:hypothetical protein